MGYMAEIEHDWKPICTNTLFEILTDYPLACKESKPAKGRLYFDLKLGRLLIQQENGQMERQSIEDSALPEHEPKSFFSLREVALLGLAVGILFVVAVMLFVSKIPSEIPSVKPVEPSGRVVIPINWSPSSNFVLQARMAMRGKTSAKYVSANSAIAKLEPDAGQSAETDVRRAVTQWAGAWSRQDAESYLACYAGDFRTPDGMSLAEWEAQRELRIAKPHSIKVALKQIEVSFAGDGIATVRFVQDYRADSYLEKGTKKELRLKNENGRWRIFSEKTIF